MVAGMVPFKAPSGCGNKYNSYHGLVVCYRHIFICFTYVISFNPHNSSMRLVVLLEPKFILGHADLNSLH